MTRLSKEIRWRLEGDATGRHDRGTLVSCPLLLLLLPLQFPLTASEQGDLTNEDYPTGFDVAHHAPQGPVSMQIVSMAGTNPKTRFSSTRL